MPSGGIKYFTKVVADISSIYDKSEKYVTHTISDIKSRGPGWIAKGVAEEYNVTAKAVQSGEMGRLKIKGGQDRLEFVYSGGRSDLRRFVVKPRSKAPSKRTYGIDVEIKRGKRKQLSKVSRPTKEQYRENIAKNFRREGTQNSPSSPIMLMRMSNQRNYHPFQRMSQKRTDLQLKQTLSLPQMVTIGENGPLHPAPAKYFNDGVLKRVEHNRERFLK